MNTFTVTVTAGAEQWKLAEVKGELFSNPVVKIHLIWLETATDWHANTFLIFHPIPCYET